MFTQALIEIDLAKDDALEFHEEWNMEDQHGNKVPAGSYWIEVKVMIGLKTGTIDQNELKSRAFVELNG